MERTCTFLVTKQLYRRLLPLMVTRFMKFREKHGSDRDGFVMELKRLNVLDEPEMERITNGYFLSKEPTLIWLIEWTLTYEMRSVFDVYGLTPDFPYVIISPYKFIGHLFQVIASQWLITNGADMTVHEMDKFLKVCLQEHLDRNVPIVPHNTVGPVQRTAAWRDEMLQLHQRLWNEFPDLRPYIRYHDQWFQQQTTAAAGSKNDKTSFGKELRVLTKTVADLADCLKKTPPPPPPPQAAPVAPPPAAASPATLAPAASRGREEDKKAERRDRRRERRERKEKERKESSSDSSGSDRDAGQEKTISAKIDSDEDGDGGGKRSSGSSSDSSGSD